ncbi:MAG: hypothetical protein PHG25_02090 [Candidatus Pacebacteria bacterium]|nr:hypothetical protein [Candidatus Paceibacterota bacterium]
MNTNIKKFESSRSFYEMLKCASGLEWSFSKFCDKNDLSIRHHALGQWGRIERFVLRLRLARAVVIGLVIVGLLNFVVRLTPIVLNMSDAMHSVMWLMFIIILALWSMLKLVSEIVKITDEMLDSWIAQHWLTKDFEETFKAVADLREDRTSPYSEINWMRPRCAVSDAEGYFFIPLHITKQCEAKLVSMIVHGCLDDSEEKKHVNKTRLNEFFLACQRLGIISTDEKVGTYYGKAKRALKKTSKDLAMAS